MPYPFKQQQKERKALVLFYHWPFIHMDQFCSSVLASSQANYTDSNVKPPPAAFFKPHHVAVSVPTPLLGPQECLLSTTYILQYSSTWIMLDACQHKNASSVLHTSFSIGAHSTRYLSTHECLVDTAYLFQYTTGVHGQC